MKTSEQPLQNRAMISFSVMLTAIMVLLDMTIANVSLPHMMGSLGVTSQQVTWVITSYSMAEAIFIPLASYFSQKFGIRKLILISIIGFIVTSALCGQATSLLQMILFRVMQGAFGASIIPLAQSTMIQIYPSSERGKAMSLFSVGVLLGPILGPTVGGIITQHMDWRWIFYVNVPVGLFYLWMLYKFIYLDGKKKTAIDIPLAIGMAVGIGLLQMVLEKGNEDGWFSSNLILFSTIISLMAWGFFVLRSIKTKGPIAPIWLLKDRNLAVSCLIIACFALGLFGITQLQPMFLEELLHYPVETIGFLMTPRGLTSAITLLILSSFIDKLDTRYVIIVGVSICALGTYLMTQYSLNIDTK